MKKAFAGALLVSLATVGLATASAGGKKQIETRVRVAYDARGSTAPDFDVAVFLGAVRADRKTCKSGRKVTVSTISGQSVGSDKATDGGKFEIDASGFGPGNYAVKVHKKKTAKVVCRGTTKSFKAK